MYWIIFLSGFITINALESRVFNGNLIHPPEHGYLVKLDIDYKYKCSGSIISANWILSSAHCFSDVEMIIVYQKTGTGRNRALATVYSHNIKIHPFYIDDEAVKHRQDDIALLKTTAPIILNEHTWAIKLTRLSPSIGESAVIAGYGDNEVRPFLPREGTVQISQCPYDDVKDLLCSIDKVRAGDADSGGALTWKGKLVGVTSASCRGAHLMHVEKCTTVYANVAIHFNWILTVTTFPDA